MFLQLLTCRVTLYLGIQHTLVARLIVQIVLLYYVLENF